MISVIIPIYNRARYIKDCLESVFKQTNKDYEIILVDDGSTDNLREALIPYMERINYIYKENEGAASARNIGIKNAKGEYIAFLDSDDKWLNFKLELQLKVLNKLPSVGFIYTDFSCFSDSKGKIANSYMRKYFFTLNTYKLKFKEMYKNHSSLEELDLRIKDVSPDINIYWGDVFDKTLLGPFFPTCTVLIRKKCFEKIGLLNENFETGEDYQFFVRVSKQFEVACIDYPTTAYRRFHADQLSGANMEIASNLALLKVVQELGLNDQVFYEKNRKHVDSRLSHCYYGVGLAYYRKKKYKEALANFLISLKINCKQRKIYLYIAVSLPIIIIGSLLNFLFRSKVKNG